MVTSNSKLTSAPSNRHSAESAREAAAVAVGTLASRVLGFVRDMVLAYVLGPGADAFLVAFRVPNFFRRLLAEGSLGMAHGAAVSRQAAANGAAAALAFSRAVSLSVFLLSIPFALALGLAAIPLVFLMAPGFSAYPELLEKAATLLKLSLPYLPLCVVSAIGFSHQAAMGRFAPQAWGSALLNCAVLTAGCAGLLLPPQTLALFSLGGVSGIEPLLCLGVVLGGALQAALVVRVSGIRSGFQAAAACIGSSKNRAAFVTPDVRAVLRSMPATALGAAPHQLHVLGGTVLASFLASGNISALYFAERLFELPLGLAGVAIGIVALPRLAAFAERKDLTAFALTLTQGVRLSAFLSFPAAAGLFGLAGPLSLLLFGHGAYGEEEVARTASALQAYSLGLPAMCATRPLLAAVSALGEGRLPLKTAGQSLGVVLLAGFVSIVSDGITGSGVTGIAAGIALGAWVNAWLLLRHVRRQGIDCPVQRAARTLYEYAAGGGLMATALLYVPVASFPAGVLMKATMLSALIFVCILLWVGILYLRSNSDSQTLISLLRKSGRG